MARSFQSFLLFGVVVMVVMVGGAKSFSICNMDTNQLSQCLPAIQPPVSPPTTTCCDVIHRANITCLCSYKNLLPTFGVDPGVAMQLPKKCNMTSVPDCASK
ncbi:Bifunctional inhibitor/plant lipid transfer protein/seed storage helical domain [Thalictrum thalictroides]|uniref:Bifunctional inhibitor/plant lipid transfer protein/seed storage helical domain n=1 Tax=Thalictrum thalictroides TaxID=46969 RepID=A0A7J6WQL2_THATH|nr:Bifunctional inhibitor/plant lipid transfer protein/seed storage helical domain [Thalictrum thalictroides]